MGDLTPDAREPEYQPGDEVSIRVEGEDEPLAVKVVADHGDKIKVRIGQTGRDAFEIEPDQIVT